MPEIIFSPDPDPLSLGLTRVSYEEEHLIGSGIIGAVFRGQGFRQDGELLDVVIKLPETLSSEVLIIEEFNILRNLAAETTRLHGRAYTPLVQQGRRKSDQLAALVMPLYSIGLKEKIRSAVNSRRLIDADRLGVRAAIEFTYILDGLHALGHTCTDRKVSDLFLLPPDDDLAVIDWNSLKEDSPQNRSSELRIAAGQIWHELFLGLKSATGSALDDAGWYPIEHEVEEGAPCVALRFILQQALSSDPDEQFKGNAGYLRETLQTLQALLMQDPGQLESLSFTADLLGPHVHLTTAEAQAVSADLIWRMAGASRPSEAYARRQEAFEKARVSGDYQQFEDLSRQIAAGEYRQVLGDLDTLVKRPTISTLLWQQIERWRRLVQALRDRDEHTADWLYQKRGTLLDLWLSLDQMSWEDTPPARLNEARDTLQKVIDGVSEKSPARQQLQAVQDEIDLRLQLQDYQTTRHDTIFITQTAGMNPALRQAYQNQIAALDQITADIHRLPETHYLKSEHSRPGGLGLLEQAIDLAGERERLEGLLQIEQQLSGTYQQMVLQLIEDDIDAAEEVYWEAFERLQRLDGQSITRLDLPALPVSAADRAAQTQTSAVKKLKTVTEPLHRLIHFYRHKDSLAVQLDGKLAEAQRLSLLLGKHRDLTDKPFEWLRREIEEVLARINHACEQRDFTTVCNPATLADYQTLYHYQSKLPGDMRKQYEQLQGDYDRLRRFFNRYLEQTDGGQATIRAEVWHTLFDEAREVNANMTDLIDLSSQEWQNVLKISAVTRQVQKTVEDLQAQLGDDFRDLIDRVDEQVEELKERAGEVSRSNTKYTEQARSVVLQAIKAQVLYAFQAGLAAARVFDLEAASEGYDQGDEALQHLGPHWNEVSSDEQQLIRSQHKALDEALQELKGLANLAYYREANRHLSQSPAQLPEEVDRVTYAQFSAEIERDAQRQPGRLLRTLQDKYWAVRIERVRGQELGAEALEMRLAKDEAQLANALLQVAQQFHANQISRVRTTLDTLKRTANALNLGTALIREIVRLWEARLAAYTDCLRTAQGVQTLLMNPDDESRIEPLRLLDHLAQSMRQCPPDAFNPYLLDEWKRAVNSTCDLLDDSDEVASVRRDLIREAENKGKAVTMAFGEQGSPGRTLDRGRFSRSQVEKPDVSSFRNKEGNQS